MSYVILNGEISKFADSKLLASNRSFRYGDGIFETMQGENNKVRHLSLHWQRLKLGASILHFHLPQSFDIEYIKQSVKRLITHNKIEGEFRVRLQIFRHGEGLYLPKSNKIEWLLEVSKAANPYKIHVDESNQLNVGFCESILLNNSAISQLKTCNSIPYILAAIEKSNKGFDDLIILDGNKNIAECCSSNIFWWDGRTVFTPSLQSGCIAGIMRSVIIDHFKKNNFTVEEGLFKIENLKSAKAIFTSNCTGVKFINSIKHEGNIWKSYENIEFTNSPVFSSIQLLF